MAKRVILLSDGTVLLPAKSELDVRRILGTLDLRGDGRIAFNDGVARAEEAAVFAEFDGLMEIAEGWKVCLQDK